MLKYKLKKAAEIFFRTFWVYLFYLIAMVIAIALFLFVKKCLSNTDADFEVPIEDAGENASIGSNRVQYNYFLDFSPSMQGFLYEDINTDMKRIADSFEVINAENENNRFYWCRDNIDMAESASDFYESMRSDGILDRYYGRILRNVSVAGTAGEEGTEGEETRNELEQAIDNLDLSNVFTPGFMDTLDEGMDTLNVIITDMNFFRDSRDFEWHNERIESFAHRLQEAAVNADICIYAVESNYVGMARDAYDGSRGNSTSTLLYVIVFSENEGKFVDFCSRFEKAMELSRVQKFELRNHINGVAPILDGDLAAFRALDLEITKENLNYANGVFKNLDSNELALQLVIDNTTSAVFAAPIAEVDFSGYGVPATMGLDDSKVSVEIDLYQNKIQSPWRSSYEAYEDTAMILDKSAGMYYAVDKWFLRVNLTMSTHPKVSEPDTWYERMLTGMRRNYIVLNLKFYMESPSFTVPDWIANVGYVNIDNAEEVHTIGMVIDSLMQYKKERYAALPLSDRYLGNKVIYLLY